MRTIPSTSTNPVQLAKELRERVDPDYAHMMGTDSFERLLCAATIEALLEIIGELKSQRQQLLADLAGYRKEQPE